MMRIPFAKVDCSGNELKYVREVIESGWLTTAAKCAEFERRFAAAVGARHSCAVNSATAALHLAAEAAGIHRGHKVLVPTLTFTATAEVVRYLGADPVFLDVEYGTGLVTPAILAAAVKKHPDARAFIPVHFGGQAADMVALLDISRRAGLRVIEDAAHAFPTRHAGRMIGSFGDATCFSFYANKTLTTGEGGMLTTDDEDLIRRARVMRLHGIDRDVWDRFTSDNPEWEYDVVAPGFKYNLSDLCAAIGLAQLERAEGFRAARQQCAEFYFRNLADCDALDLPCCKGPPEDHAWHLFWVVLNNRSRVDRNTVIARMNAAGIGTSVHYKPLHRMSYYRQRYALAPEDYPAAERHWRGCISLPMYPTLQPDEMAFVCARLKESLRP